MSRIVLIFIVTISCLSIMSCAGNRNKSKVVVDTKGVDMQVYEQDMAECKELSDQTQGQAAKGAVGGAVVGGAIGAIGGNRRHNDAERGAGIGATLGVASGASATQAEKSQIQKNCMRHRGYTVLN